jgi:hypothetical protein
MLAPMTLTSKLALSFAGLATVAFGGFLWLRFGNLVYFDVVAASFAGCFL